MRAMRVEGDLRAEIWQAGLEATERLRRKAARPPLPEGMTKKACRRDTLGRLRLLADAKTAGANVSVAPLKARCAACGRCSLAPRRI